MEKLGLQEKAKGNETARKLTVTNNDVSMDIGYEDFLKPLCMHQMLYFFKYNCVLDNAKEVVMSNI